MRVGPHHAWGTNRHSGNSKPDEIRAFIEQPCHEIRRHMTLYDIAVHSRGMTALQLAGNAVLGLDRGEGREIHVLYVNRISVVL